MPLSACQKSQISRRSLGHPVCIPKRSRAHTIQAAASRTDSLRQLLREPGIHRVSLLQGPCCHDALSAKLIEDAGFPFAFMSGFCTAAATAALPDTGLLSYGEIVAVGRRIHEATSSMPIIGDGDTGYGNAINVKRTVRGFAAAGFAGILIEDQEWPKSCGHVENKRVVPREVAVARVRAAVDARDGGDDIVIVARTDARQAVSLEEALARVEAFAEAGADVLFIDALESVDEMKQFTQLRGVASGTAKMASLLEGGGKTPLVPPEQLQLMGFKLLAYPLSLLSVSVKAMQAALVDLKAGSPPAEEKMTSFADLQTLLGFQSYFAEAKNYAVEDTPSASATAAASAAAATEERSSAAEDQQGAASSSNVVDESSTNARKPEPSSSTTAQSQFRAATGSSGGDAVEADAIFEEGSGPDATSTASGKTTQAVIVRPEKERSKAGIDFSNSKLRVRVTDTRTGKVELETVLPANFMAPVVAIVPQLVCSSLALQ